MLTQLNLRNIIKGVLSRRTQKYSSLIARKQLEQLWQKLLAFNDWRWNWEIRVGHWYFLQVSALYKEYFLCMVEPRFLKSPWSRIVCENRPGWFLYWWKGEITCMFINVGTTALWLGNWMEYFSRTSRLRGGRSFPELSWVTWLVSVIAVPQNLHCTKPVRLSTALLINTFSLVLVAAIIPSSANRYQTALPYPSSRPSHTHMILKCQKKGIYERFLSLDHFNGNTVQSIVETDSVFPLIETGVCTWLFWGIAAYQLWDSSGYSHSGTDSGEIIDLFFSYEAWSFQQNTNKGY